MFLACPIWATEQQLPWAILHPLPPPDFGEATHSAAFHGYSQPGSLLADSQFGHGKPGTLALGNPRNAFMFAMPNSGTPSTTAPIPTVFATHLPNLGTATLD